MLLGHAGHARELQGKHGHQPDKILLCLLSKHRSYLSFEGKVNSCDICPEIHRRIPKIQKFIPQCRKQRAPLNLPCEDKLAGHSIQFSRPWVSAGINSPRALLWVPTTEDHLRVKRGISGESVLFNLQHTSSKGPVGKGGGKVLCKCTQADWLLQVHCL